MFVSGITVKKWDSVKDGDVCKKGQLFLREPSFSLPKLWPGGKENRHRCGLGWGAPSYPFLRSYIYRDHNSIYNWYGPTLHLFTFLAWEKKKHQRFESPNVFQTVGVPGFSVFGSKKKLHSFSPEKTMSTNYSLDFLRFSACDFSSPLLWAQKIIVLHERMKRSCRLGFRGDAGKNHQGVDVKNARVASFEKKKTQNADPHELDFVGYLNLKEELVTC